MARSTDSECSPKRSQIDHEERETFLPGIHQHYTHQQKTKSMLVVGITSILWIISIFLTWKISQWNHEKYRYETGYATELEPLRPEISLERVKFTGAFKFDDNGTLYRELDGSRQYVGEPSEEIERAWSELNPGGDDGGIYLTGEDAKAVRGKTYQKLGAGWFTSTALFHQLHCVNMVRQGLRRDQYTDHDPEPIYMIHLDHCIDYLRQAVMCSADLTPLFNMWSEPGGRVVPHYGGFHTCRNFDKIHSWWQARDRSSRPITTER